MIGVAAVAARLRAGGYSTLALELERQCMELGVGERRTLTLPYSEVCMHMQVAGKVMDGVHVGRRMVQLIREDGGLFSFPITEGEAGWGMTGSDHTMSTFDADGRWIANS